MSTSSETFNSLWDYCTANQRVVPMPQKWSALYQKLKGTWQKPTGGWEPPIPLILAAWHDTSALEKQLRLREHLQWAEKQDQLQEIGIFLRALDEKDWCHLGES
ncbi:MAG TPA: hypothetical protein DD706_00440 [Nitrospiraceae bacterium]|nr:hypothetical protein [Nitrospiraceae bacterium]